MLYVIHLRGTGSSETRLAAILQAGLSGTVYEEINDPDVFLLRAADLQGQACLFAISLGRGGANDAYHRLITLLYTHTDFLAGVCAGLVIDGPDELFTKKWAENCSSWPIGQAVSFRASLLSKRRAPYITSARRQASWAYIKKKPIKRRLPG